MYLVTVHAVWSTGDVDGVRAFRVRRVTDDADVVNLSQSGATAAPQEGSGIVRLSAGDQPEVGASQNSGSTLNLFAPRVQVAWIGT